MPLPHRRLSLWFRIGGLLALVIAFVVGLLSFLNYANFRKTVHGLIETRYTVLGADARQTVTAGLALGLAPDQNAQLGEVFKRLTARWPAVRFAGVVDADGRLLVGTGTQGPQDSANWRKHIGEGKLDAVWRTHSEHNDAIGLTLADNFGGKAGAVVIAYDDRELQQASDAMANQLLLRAVAVLVIAAVLAWLGTWWLTRALAEELDAAESLLDTDLDAATPLPTEDERPLVAETRDFVSAARSAAHTLAEAR